MGQLHALTQSGCAGCSRLGALLLAVGSNPDKKGARSYPAGSFVFVPANMEHTMGADVDTIIIGTAIGPWKTHDNEAPHHH
ncbi:hypothetical protein SBA7_610017 [Candidatus Sulfotelmatobacter sp. SbA7]|nr:hypothetical protein SBA7_610017 [Candidatus Sulfotelmatobacter sp. SbA7]